MCCNTSYKPSFTLFKTLLVVNTDVRQRSGVRWRNLPVFNLVSRGLDGCVVDAVGDINISGLLQLATFFHSYWWIILVSPEILHSNQ